jgi:hypothetical protein
MHPLVCVALAGLVTGACAANRGGSASVETDGRSNADVVAESYVYFYPLRDQDESRQARDRYECYLWAVDQTGFDPSLPGLEPHQRIRAVAIPPPGHDVVHGAVTGAVVGAIVGHPHHIGESAAIGAAVGAVAGAVHADQVERGAEAHAAELEARRRAELERLAQNYRRAVSACLEGRGYAVQ